MLKREAEQVEGITLKMKSYIKDIDHVLEILDMQDEYSQTTYESKLFDLDNKLTLKRARIDNQVLIKNYNFSEFLGDVDSTVQDCMNYMMQRSDLNCFPAYIIDFTWKIIQVKLAFMIRNLNFKINNDFKDKDLANNNEIKKNN